jgi:hypothetical protein
MLLHCLCTNSFSKNIKNLWCRVKGIVCIFSAASIRSPFLKSSTENLQHWKCIGWGCSILSHWTLPLFTCSEAFLTLFYVTYQSSMTGEWLSCKVVTAVTHLSWRHMLIQKWFGWDWKTIFSGHELPRKVESSSSLVHFATAKYYLLWVLGKSEEGWVTFNTLMNSGFWFGFSTWKRAIREAGWSSYTNT